MSRVWSFFGKEVVTGGTTGTMIYVLDFCSVTLISIGFDYVVGTGDVTDVTAGVVVLWPTCIRFTLFWIRVVYLLIS